MGEYIFGYLERESRGTRKRSLGITIVTCCEENGKTKFRSEFRIWEVVKKCHVSQVDNIGHIGHFLNPIKSYVQALLRIRHSWEKMVTSKPSPRIEIWKGNLELWLKFQKIPVTNLLREIGENSPQKIPVQGKQITSSNYGLRIRTGSSKEGLRGDGHIYDI